MTSAKLWLLLPLRQLHSGKIQGLQCSAKRFCYCLALRHCIYCAARHSVARHGNRSGAGEFARGDASCKGALARGACPWRNPGDHSALVWPSHSLCESLIS